MQSRVQNLLWTKSTVNINTYCVCACILPPQTEHFISLYWGDSSSAAAAEAAAWHHGSSRSSYLERHYRLDRPQFKSLYGLLAPWPSGSEQHADTLANRTFTLLDQDCNSLVAFREFARWLGGLAHAASELDLKLFSVRRLLSHN